MNFSIVKDCDAISAKIKDMVQVAEGDNTKITKVGGGKMILVEVPTARLACSSNLRRRINRSRSSDHLRTD